MPAPQPTPVAARCRQLVLRGVAVLTLGSMSLAGATAPTAFAAEPLNTSWCVPYTPSGQTSSEAWQVERLRLGDAWQLATGKGVTVGVVDTGTSNINTAYFNANNVVSENVVPLDDEDRKNGLDCKHGTGVVSLINASNDIADPRTNFAGVAPDAKVIAYRALKVPRDKEGNPQAEPVDPTIKAVDEAINRKVQVINISQVSGADNAKYRAVIAKAIAAGIVVVAAAGNADSGLSGPAYPAAYPGVISVGASKPDDTASDVSYKASGFEVTVAAPGDTIKVLRPSAAIKGKNRPTTEQLVTNQAYGEDSGTSFAAPMVAGVVAMMLERNPRMTPAQVKQRLIETADRPVGTAPHPQLGWGVVNPVRALAGPAVATTGHPSPSTTEKSVVATAPPPVDQRPQQITLGIAAGAGALTVLALTLKLVLPAAARRGYAPADPPRD